MIKFLIYFSFINNFLSKLDIKRLHYFVFKLWHVEEFQEDVQEKDPVECL